MKTQLKLNDPQETRLHNIIDMGLGFSAMIRLFDKGTKRKLRKSMITMTKKVFLAKSEEEFKRLHSEFCQWGKKEIGLARKSGTASYGQIAKTLDVVLKVAVYYCHLPECGKSKQLSRWLNAAVDRRMMAMLKKYYPKAIEPWPSAIEQVDSGRYIKIQEIVRKFINERHNGSITPVQFDDIYWEALNRPKALPTNE